MQTLQAEVRDAEGRREARVHETGFVDRRRRTFDFGPTIAEGACEDPALRSNGRGKDYFFAAWGVLSLL